MSKQLLIFGDSVLRGVIYDGETGKYHLCKDKLGIEAHNLCRMGATSRQGVETVRKMLDVCDENTVALIEYGGNDCNYDWPRISQDPALDLPCAVMPEEYENNLKTICRLLTDKGSQVIFSSLLPLEENKFMRYISQGLSYDNILSWLGTVHRLTEWQAYYNAIVTDCAKKWHLPLLDLRSSVSADESDLFCLDGIHPTEAGHEKIHRFLENTLPSFT